MSGLLWKVLLKILRKRKSNPYLEEDFAREREAIDKQAAWQLRESCHDYKNDPHHLPVYNDFSNDSYL
jgi:hypothetical protein